MSATGAKIVIRPALASDAPVLAEFGARTFIDTFGADNDPSNIATYVAGAYATARIEADIADADSRLLICELAGDPIAFAHVRRGACPPAPDARAPIEIVRFYVAREHHGQGVAARLMSAALDTAREMNGETIWLAVWERNPRAMAFYAKHGFVHVGAQDFWMGPERQSDLVMMRSLR